MISMDKKYTLDGDVFTILTITKPGHRPVAGYTSDGSMYSFKADGSIDDRMCRLVEVIPYADFVIDEKVMVRDFSENKWQRRYFAGVDKLTGLAKADFGQAWIRQKSSVDSWRQCRRPTTEELAT